MICLSSLHYLYKEVALKFTMFTYCYTSFWLSLESQMVIDSYLYVRSWVYKT